MLAYIWPIGLVILSNTIYHICSKQMPDGVNPMAALTVTYAVGALAALGLYYITGGRALLSEYKGMNFAPAALGVVIVGLEAGFLYAYRAGWSVSTAQLVASALVSAALIFVGALLFREKITWNKLVGIIICLIGLGFINFK